MKSYINVKRKTKESQIEVSLDFKGLQENYKENINTPIPFLNHMIEHISYRSGINILINMKLDKFDLTHVVFEDIGMAVGKAIYIYLKENVQYGIKGYGNSVGIIDEAYSICAISFENRTYFDFNSKIEVPSETESTLSEDLQTFLEGFCQGANCTLHIDIIKGINGHHIWESIYRAFGEALKNSLISESSIENKTAGVCGVIDYEIEVR